VRLPPSQEVIDEWVDSPVTEYLRYLVDEEIEFYDGRPLFFPGDPQKTQETLLETLSTVTALQRVQEALKGDFSEFSSEDEGESE